MVLDDYIEIGTDIYGAFRAVKTHNAVKFTMLFSDALVTGGHIAGIKEMTPDVVAEFESEINSIFTKIMAHVHPAA